MKKLILLFTVVLFSISLNAQRYKEMMDDLSVNFYDVCKEADKYFETINKDQKGSGYKGYQRWKYANEYKFYPSGQRDRIDPYFVEHAFEAYLKNNPSQANVKSLFNNGWEELGPYVVDNIMGGYSAGLGRVEEIYVDPNDPDRMYLGSRSGGFWKTTDGGVTWQGSTTDFLIASGVNAIATPPGQPMNILINVQNAKNGYSNGIYRSTDGGDSWTLTNFSPANVGYGGLGSNFKVFKIVYHPTVPNLVFIGTNKGLYWSTDNLLTWTRLSKFKVTDLYSAEVTDIDFHPTDPDVIYALDTYYWNNNHNYVYTSTDQGQTFSESMEVAGNAGATGYLSVSPDCPNCVFFASNNGIWKSTNQGANFTFLINPGSECHGGFAVNDLDVDNMIYGYLDTEASTDGGVSFNQVTWWSLGNANNGPGSPQDNFLTTTAYVHADLRDAECVNGVFYVATDGFLCKSTDNGATWHYLSQGTAIRENYKLGVSQSNHYRSISGSQDCGTSIKQQSTWIEFYGGDGMEGIVHPLNDDWMIGSSQYGGRIRTKDGGQTQGGVNPAGQTGSGNGAWEAPLLYDPNNQMRVYHFSTIVNVSEDFGSSWTAKGSPVTFTDPIKQAAIAENNSDIMVIALDSEIEKSTDGGATFVDIKNNLPGDAIQDIAFDPLDDDVIIVVYATYQNNGNKVFMTTDGGANWTNITSNLGNMPVHTVVIDASDDSNIYLGAEIGVFTKPMTGTTWTLYNPDLPNVSVEELEIVYGSNTLKAASWGRGLWEYTLVGRTDYPSILKTYITDQPTDDLPKETVPQYVTSEITYNNTLSSVYLEWSVNSPTFGNQITMSNTGGNTWVSDTPLPDYPAGTKMYFKVFAVGASGDITETYKFMYTVKPFVYCDATGNNNGGYNELHISNVTIANVNNTTSDNAYYTLFSNLVNLEQGQTYTISVQGSVNYAANDYDAWIDYNGDAEFGSGESLGLVKTTNTLATATFTVPMSAITTKQLRLRTRLSYFTAAAACGNTFGEVEDYPVQAMPPDLQEISITDVTMNEGSASGTTTFNFTATVDDNSANPITLYYNTSLGTAQADDINGVPNGFVTFTGTQTTATISIDVNKDCLAEPDETFYVNLTSSTAGTIIDNQGVGTIVNDDIAPAITCPGSLSPAILTLDNSCSVIVPDYTNQVTATFDATCANLVQSPAPGTTASGAGSLTITFTIDDGDNPVASCSGTVQLTDGIDPVVNCPADITVVNTAGLCGANVTFALTGSDNCGAFSIGTTHNSGDFFPVGTTTVTATATDVALNTASCNFTITVNDAEDPQISCPTLATVVGCSAVIPDLTMPAGTTLANSSADFSGTQGNNGWQYGKYAAFDAAGFSQLPNWTGFVWNNLGVGAILDFPQLDPNGGHPQFEGLTWAVRRWTSTFTGEVNLSGNFYDRDGNCGDGANVRILLNGTQKYEYLNISTGSVGYNFNLNVVVGDVLDFVIDPKFDAACDDTHFTAVISTVNGVSPTDNCAVVNVTQNLVPGTVVGPGNNEIVITAFDAAGNSGNCTATLTVQDNEDPVTPTLADVTGECSATATAPTTTDNCAGTITGTTTDALTYSTQGTHVITWTFDDGNGNVITATQNVVIEDVNDPVIPTLADVTGECSATATAPTKI
ncbi:MAG: HYR domain-containing protein, partial [Saprospiraceae bacterium]|nr:HYR domain-containing protein [Saprospiraceae bacterium]